jgi:hypothetical protein
MIKKIFIINSNVRNEQVQNKSHFTYFTFYSPNFPFKHELLFSIIIFILFEFELNYEILSNTGQNNTLQILTSKKYLNLQVNTITN